MAVAFQSGLHFAVARYDATDEIARHNWGSVVGHAMSDGVICRNCYSTARYPEPYGQPFCANCGELECLSDRVPIGFYPVNPPQVSGYYIDNPAPLAGYRTPAKLWVEGQCK